MKHYKQFHSLTLKPKAIGIRIVESTLWIHRLHYKYTGVTVFKMLWNILIGTNSYWTMIILSTLTILSRWQDSFQDDTLPQSFILPICNYALFKDLKGVKGLSRPILHIEGTFLGGLGQPGWHDLERSKQNWSMRIDMSGNCCFQDWDCTKIEVSANWHVWVCRKTDI